MLRAPFEAPNQSVNGAARMLVLALPEHRIEALWYREIYRRYTGDIPEIYGRYKEP
jgi:hypothetical protein